jgi:hypothetical protein
MARLPLSTPLDARLSAPRLRSGVGAKPQMLHSDCRGKVKGSAGGMLAASACEYERMKLSQEDPDLR